MLGNDYQARTAETAIYPDKKTGTALAISYTLFGLLGEVGELANKWKKYFRDHNGQMNQTPPPGLKEALRAELGDCAWYLARLADELDYPLDELFGDNIAKLKSRQERNTLTGSGDNR